MSTKSFLKAAFLTGVVFCATAPMLAQAQSRTPAYKAPRVFGNLPDLSGSWSNVTLTPMQRAASFGDRLVMTEEEVRARETDALELLEAGNVKTDPNQGTEDTSVRNCTGPGGRDCGYNAGWKDSTTRVMRVGGEARTSFIISPANGRMPPRVGAPAGGGGGRGGGLAGRGGGGGRGGAPGAPGAARGGGGAPGAPGAGRGGGRGAAPDGDAESGPAPTQAAFGRGGPNDNPESHNLGDRCIIAFSNNGGPPITPNGYYNNNIRLVQGKDSVAILIEMVHDVRTVRLNSTHRTDGVRPFFGDSIGWYEGDTLVVETVGFEPRTSVQGANTPQTKVIERFTRVARDRLHYKFTVSDPTVWTEPWTGEYEFQGGMGDVYEYACHEGNYGLEGMLAGARDEEQRAAAASGRGAR